ncbi:MAG TPA: succinate dehydrogenase, hydrophobic membrane anchor protein [Pseudomonadales bacterium]|nr:succinate dehydrogenase, hydrophobic membrane anchor protein [Pseudomonadales bacterium]
MVASVTNFGRSGVYDWVVQRVSGVVIGVYLLLVLGYLFFHPSLEYTQWHGFMTCAAMQIASTLVLLAILAHSWIGLWVITTDYLNNTFVRFSCQSLCGVVAAVYLVWGVKIVWGL